MQDTYCGRGKFPRQTTESRCGGAWRPPVRPSVSDGPGASGQQRSAQPPVRAAGVAPRGSAGSSLPAWATPGAPESRGGRRGPDAAALLRDSAPAPARPWVPPARGPAGRTGPGRGRPASDRRLLTSYGGAAPEAAAPLAESPARQDSCVCSVQSGPRAGGAAPAALPGPPPGPGPPPAGSVAGAQAPQRPVPQAQPSLSPPRRHQPLRKLCFR